MTSKEVLKEMCDYCRKCINQIPSNGDRPYKECPYRGISNDYCENYEIIKKDLDRLEKLEQENQELKEQVNHLNKVIEVMQNPSKLDCTHMFDNCKELKPLTEKKEHKMTSKEGLKLLETRCRFFAQDEDELQETYEAREAIKKDLEILEIIKKWSFIQEGYKVGYGPYTQFLCNIHTVGMEEDFYKVKEWLENGND